MEQEYHYYIFPEISSWEHTGKSKICHQFDHKVANPDPALDLDGLYEAGHLCPKCAFYCGLWYDRGKGSSILEHIKIKVRPTHPKSPASPYWIEKIDIYEGNQSSDMSQCSIKKIKEQYQTLVSKKVFKEADFAALSQTQQILDTLYQRIAKNPNGISIFQEVIT